MSWLWRGDDTSPASFEKALSKLSTQITAANLSLDTRRIQARRIKGLWTLWTTILYILYALIVILVPTGKDTPLTYYAGLPSGPVLIFGVRKVLTIAFDWTINRRQAHVNALQKQREGKIADLKKATKYDSTQELLQKYGGAPPKDTSKRDPKQQKTTPQKPQQRTGIAPPPTANIPGRSPPSARPQIRPASPQGPPGSPTNLSQSPSMFEPDSPGFAPNAFSGPPSASSSYQTKANWYDRILDVMIGEDETAAKNRLALICSNCRLVNGLAPPGARTLEEVGRWRCSSCGSENGTDQRRAAREMVENVRRSAGANSSPTEHAPAAVGDDNGWEQVAKGDRGDEDEEDESRREPKEEVKLKGQEGSTGRESSNGGSAPTSATKRVTRSMAADDEG
jgi:endoplasmic reticulum junction formation protein lunapark